MFRLFQISNNEKLEVIPENNFYTVFELGEYEFEYFSNNIIDNKIFIEDEQISIENVIIDSNSIKVKKDQYFIDYFGFSSIKINNDIFPINIQIQKLKQEEIEEILIFLWEKENRLFQNFFSRSSLKAKYDSSQNRVLKTSKFLDFTEKFYEIFDNYKTLFLHNSITKLKYEKKILDFSPDLVSYNSIDWILSNLDLINLDYNKSNHPNAFKIKNQYAYLSKIEQTKNLKDFNVYENQIILGAIEFLQDKLYSLHKEINQNLSSKKFSIGKNLDFRDLKRIPLISLDERLNTIIKKFIKLKFYYKKIFPNTISLKQPPRATVIFQKKQHYQKLFFQIKSLYNFKFNLGEELNLFNIQKLSTLYEVYNFYQIDLILENLLIKTLNYNKFESTSYRYDQIIDKVSYKNNIFEISLYYELKYPDGYYETDLLVINKLKTFFRPDFIIEIKNNLEKNYYILDSKYSKLSTIQNKSLRDCIDKYLLFTGIKNEKYKKPNFLVLLYPGDLKVDTISHTFYLPQIQLIPSKPQANNYLEDLIFSILKSEQIL